MGVWRPHLSVCPSGAAQRFIIVVIPLFVFPFMVLLAALGLLWAPFGALICALTAKSRGLSIRSHAIAGAVYSILFLVPWFYLWAWQRNRPLSAFTSGSGYFLLYGLWIFGAIGEIAVLLLTHSGYNPSGAGTSDGMWALMAVLVAMLILSVSLLVIAGMESYSPNIHGGRIPPLRLPSPLYLSPFAFAYISVLLLHLFIFTYSPFKGFFYN